MSKTNKHIARQRRHVRVRRKVSGTTEKPRLSVCCTSKHIYVQLIDDSKGCTVAATSSLDKTFREEKQAANLAGAEWLGKAVAAKAIAANVTKAVFDRGGFRYHGRVKAIADAARAGGLQF